MVSRESTDTSRSLRIRSTSHRSSLSIFGVRWEFHPGYSDAGLNTAKFDRTVPRTGQVVIPSDPKALTLVAPLPPVGPLRGLQPCAMAVRWPNFGSRILSEWRYNAEAPN